MKLIIFNGSPKKEKSNTRFILERFIDGYTSDKSHNHSVDTYYLFGNSRNVSYIKIFLESPNILLAFPLYFNSMPAPVKEFIEEIEPLSKYIKGNKLGFLVQYGFLEAYHARPLEQYLENLSQRLNCNYTGTILLGGSEGIDCAPCTFKRSNLKGAYLLGKNLARDKIFDNNLLDKYSQPKKNNLLYNSVTKRIAAFYGNFFHWRPLLKRNSVKNSFSQPYRAKK